MKTMEVIALCMWLANSEGTLELIEHTYIQDQKMSSCLKAKRTVERSVNPENVRMQCGEVKAVIEKDEDTGRTRVVKIIEDKYGNY